MAETTGQSVPAPDDDLLNLCGRLLYQAHQMGHEESLSSATQYRSADAALDKVFARAAAYDELMRMLDDGSTLDEGS